MKHLRVSFSFPIGKSYFSAPQTAPAAIVKVVLSDGKVQEYDDMLTVAELMLEHPRQVVVQFDSDMVITTADGSRRPVRPLPADKKLEANKVYMMLPMKRGKPASLASDEARRVVLNANALLKQLSSSSYSYKFVPLFARACTTVGHDENLVKLVTLKKEKSCDEEVKITTEMTDGKCLMSFFEEEDDVEDEEMSLVPEYLSRQLSGKGWKPSLDTIKEKKIEQQKLPHWLF